MEIVDYELFQVPPRWLFLKVITDEGVVGWGEPLIEGSRQTVSQAVKELMEKFLLGSDPHRIEDNWQAMHRGSFYRGGPILMSAIAGIDQALWDIKGKTLDVPVYELLGGRTRDRIKVFRWIGGEKPADIASEARSMVDAGYDVLKMDAVERITHIDSPETMTHAVDRIEAVRTNIGDDVCLAVDFRGRTSKATAKQLARAIEPFQIMFIEEPTSPEKTALLPEIATHTNIPIATGDRLYTRWQFDRVLQDGAVDVVQPNISHVGGISEGRRIGVFAETRDAAIAFNCPHGPIGMAAAMQVASCIPNFLVLEHGFASDSDPTSDVYSYSLDDSLFEMRDGYMAVPDKPGLGIQIDEDAVRELSSEDTTWQNPLWRHEDGSIAGW